jgi:tRNA threonylcarbamoyladenosine biosynthesis protein TsaE
MTQYSVPSTQHFLCKTPEETFELGERIGASLKGGEVILLFGTMGAGKTLLTKGIVGSLEYDIDEVTSPSFTLVNFYEGKFNIHHIDLWRLNEDSNILYGIDLDDILEDENGIIIIEWAEKLNDFPFPGKTIRIELKGDGDSPREITLTEV